ncbi:MAG: hypothetical protein ACJAXB_000483 [Candidatus Endobugula sp.]
MKNILFLFLSFFGVFQLPSQIISGVVLDSAKQSPIPYVNIVNFDTRMGTFSNSEGSFSIAVEQLPARLMLTHVSYQSRTLVIDEINDDYEINLSLGVTQLYDVVVGNLDLEQIVKEAWKRNKALGNQDFFGQAFYRQLSKVDGEFTEVHESFYEVLYNNQGFNRWQMTNGRYAFKEFLDNSKKEKNPSFLTFLV